ncbi:MAG: MBL fold metallo-hydrolase [Elusimicrobiota bacterium]
MPKKKPHTYIQFLGAAETVTGSKFLLDTGTSQVLIDCGLFQGPKDIRRRNWAPLPINASEVDAVVLTHAHIDHCGAIPRLIQQGYPGKIYCTPATKELLGLLLPDSGHLQEEEAKYANKKGYSNHVPALPLYTKADAEYALSRLECLDYGQEFEVAAGIRVRFHVGGHILGSAFAEILFEGKRLVASGDLGSYDRVVMRGPADMPSDVDYILAESTYGGRSSDSRPVAEQLREHIAPVLERGGVVVIPAFAVGRTTLVLYHIRKLQDEGLLSDVPVYIDSPMATSATKLYCRFGDEHNLKLSLLKDSGKCQILAKQTHLVRKVEDSKRLNAAAGPMIIISASGMVTGGRILHHLSNRLPEKKNLVLLVGYQAFGTRGRALLEGAKKLKLFGRRVTIRAKVAAINGLSAHGDSDDVIRWLGTLKKKPKKVFLVHGEPEGLKAMAERVQAELKFPFHIPTYLQKVLL